MKSANPINLVKNFIKFFSHQIFLITHSHLQISPYCVTSKTVSCVQIDDAAVSIIQSNIRKANIINQWSWWKLLNKIKPLMVVRKTEEEKKEISVSEPVHACVVCCAQANLTVVRYHFVGLYM